MIALRKRMAAPRSRRMLLPAVLFFVGASLSTIGAGTAAALCLVPVALVLDAARSDGQGDSLRDEQDDYREDS